MPFVPDSQQSASPSVARSRFVPDTPVVKRPHDPMNDPPLLPGEEGFDNTPSKEPSALKSVKKYAAGVNEAAGAFNRAEPAGLAGVAEAALSALTGAVAPGVGAIRSKITGEPYETAAEESVYQPRTESGRAQLGMLGALTAPLSESGADVALAGLVPDLPAGLNRPPRVPKAPAKPPVRSPELATARAAGYKVLPSEAGGGKISQALESLGGPALKKDFRRANERTTTKLAQEEIGAPSMDEAGFAKVREEGGAAYEAMKGIGKVQADEGVLSAISSLAPRSGMRANSEIAQLRGTFEELLQQPWDAASVVDEVRQLRKEATANAAPPAMGAKPDPKKQTLAKAQRQVADALDDWLERNATAMGSPEVARQYKAERQRLAKTASVERATSGGKTDVRNLGKQEDKGVPVSGRLKIASQTGEYFPESTGAVSGPEVNIQPDTLFGTARNAAQNWLLRPIISAILRSEKFQGRFGQMQDVGPEGPFRDLYPEAPPAPPPAFAEAPGAPFPPQTDAISQRIANTLAGDLELAPEGQMPNFPPTPDRMTADTPPPVTGDLPFSPTQMQAGTLAGDLGLGDFAPAQQFPPSLAGLGDNIQLLEDAPARFPQSPVAGTLAGDLGLTPEGLSLDTVSPEGPFAYGRGEWFTADPRAAMPPRTTTLRERGAPGFEVEREATLASDLGLVPELETAPDSLVRVMPAGRSVEAYSGLARPEGFEVTHGNDRLFTTPDRALAEELTAGLDSSPELGDLGSLMAELNQLALRQRPSAAGRSRVQNNASGESSASVEAINRVQAEKAAGQNRYVIDADGTVTPLVGVDAVDAVARPGQVIVQKGVGAEPYTILDRGGLNQSAARGRLNAALSYLDGG